MVAILRIMARGPNSLDDHRRKKENNMTATPSQAIAWAKKQSRGYMGLCLVFVRNCYGIAAKYPSAAEAWKHAQHKHGPSTDIPIGAPVFFSTPATAYGHVALYLGGGKYRTNYSAKGTVVTATLGKGAMAGMTLLGWSEDLNGARVLPAPSAAVGPGKHKITSGETLGGIAAKYGTTAKALAKINGIANPNKISAGAVLTLPGSSRPTSHKVRAGETLGGIAARYKTTVGRLQTANGIRNPDVISVGAVLKIK